MTKDSQQASDSVIKQAHATLHSRAAGHDSKAEVEVGLWDSGADFLVFNMGEWSIESFHAVDNTVTPVESVSRPPSKRDRLAYGIRD